MVNVIIEEPAFTIRITGGIGAQGSKGDPGNGIASAVLNDDYTLTLNFTDGTSYTTEPIRGAQGETGNGIASAVLNPDYTLTLYFTDGTHYTTASIRGAQGERGEQGAKGDPGFSPTAAVSKSGNATTLTVTDETGTTTATILDGAKGDPGDPGTSPTASVSKSGNKSTITITDDEGTTTAEVLDGENGIPGVSPTVTVTDITGGHRITITDAEHPGGISFDVMDGSDADAPVQDVLINGSSIVDANGDADIPIAKLPPSGQAPGDFGLTALKRGRGIGQNADDKSLYLDYAILSDIKSGNDSFKPIAPTYQQASAFYGLSKVAGVDLRYETVTLGTYPEASKSAIHEMLSGSIAITGTTPTINALPGLRYICGEVSTLTVNLPASGCVDITFESGSTPTVLTVTPASGQSVTFPAWFDNENLEADTVYEMSFADGYGAVMSWAT